MFLLKLDRKTVRYNGHAALSDISLNVAPGERIALVGQSGAGKSTLLQTLYEQVKDKASIVPQELGLVRSLSVFHNIFMGRLDRNSAWYNILNLIKPLQKEIEEIRPIVEKLGLEDKFFAPVQELSGGQQQRTAVGRALFTGREIFFGDEPVSAVDEHQSHAVMKAIAEAHQTVVLSMHDMNLAITYSDRLIGLKDGEIVLDEPSGGMKASDLDDLFRL
ncbi:MAG: ATP-binding cassette domain-containing protein [Rhodospirillales bacterium]|nr:ATP-binding cassette domain-containing protein [Rhodospirillales bacterium]